MLQPVGAAGVSAETASRRAPMLGSGFGGGGERASAEKASAERTGTAPIVADKDIRRRPRPRSAGAGARPEVSSG